MKTNSNDFLPEEADFSVRLISEMTGKKITHQFDLLHIQAVNTALACNRPLLITGEPGVGKTQLAKAAAKVLNRVFIRYTVDSQTESHHLIWEFDAIKRLSDAQIKHPDDDINLDCCNYLKPGPLWWGFNWKNAEQLAETEAPEKGGADPANGTVILIDEIDKAEIDVPNGLLEILGDGCFHPEGLKDPVIKEGIDPLVVITSNQERALPDAFVRRCVVFKLALPQEEDELKKWLVKVGKGHFKFEKKNKDIYEKAAKKLIEDRGDAEHRYTIGQAEYLDMLRAIKKLSEQGKDPDTLLKNMRRFIFQKGASLRG